MSTIEELIKKAENGGITDIADIERIVTGFANMPLSTFEWRYSNAVLGVVKDFMKDCQVDKDRLSEVSFGEALGVIKLFPSFGIYHDAFGKKYCCKMRYSLLAYLRYMLNEYDTQKPAVSLFMSLTVKDYFRYIGEKSGKNMEIPYQSFVSDIKKHIRLVIAEDTTIRELLLVMNVYQSRAWYPSYPIDTFEREIMKSYGDLYYFFITLFKSAFPKYFDLEVFKEKYKQ